MWTCHTHTLKAGAHLFFDYILLHFCLRHCQRLLLILFLEQLTYFYIIIASMKNDWMLHIYIKKTTMLIFFLSWCSTRLHYRAHWLSEHCLFYLVGVAVKWDSPITNKTPLRVFSIELAHSWVHKVFMCCACTMVKHHSRVLCACTTYVHVKKISQGCFGVNNIYDLPTHVGREVKGFQAEVCVF